MKFNCPGCQAKYQVPDEKLAGRSVRMKCRKCDFLIALSEVPAAPATIAPTDGELIPSLPRPPAAPSFSSPPPRAVAARAPATPSRWPATPRGATQGALATALVEPETSSLPPWAEPALEKQPERLAEPKLALAQPSSLAPEPQSQSMPVIAPRAALEVSSPPSMTADLVAAGLKPSRTPIAAWIAVGTAMALGLTLGFVLFGKQKTERVVEYVTVAAAPTDSVLIPPPAAAADDQAAEAGVEPTALNKKGGAPARSASGALAKEPEPAAAAKLDGLSALSAGNAAARPDGAAASAPSGGGQLSSEQLSATISRYRPTVKRSCWEPALAGRDPSAPATARVSLSVTVGASGSVQNASTGADPKGYPGLAGCIAGRARGWQFPPSSGSTVVQVPFVFAAQ
jgi:predicted Zn finger-like uncharacterized protein